VFKAQAAQLIRTGEKFASMASFAAILKLPSG
jgi:hypothetical protein